MQHSSCQDFERGPIAELTVNKELRPQITSFNRLVGAQPRPSMEFCRSKLRQMSPSSLMFGCHSLVKHFTLGGWNTRQKYKLQLLNSHRNYQCTPYKKCFYLNGKDFTMEYKLHQKKCENRSKDSKIRFYLPRLPRLTL